MYAQADNKKFVMQACTRSIFVPVALMLEQFKGEGGLQPPPKATPDCRILLRGQ